MLAPVPSKRSDGGSSFATLGKYLTTGVDAETGEVFSRGEVMLSPALLSAETATIEMKAVAAENSRVKDPVMHFILTWDKDEQPTSEQWQEAVTHAMGALKDRFGNSLSEHQYMAVAHNDTDNFHVHIMANRVHPESYQANAPEWSHKTLDKACREIEAAQGWKESRGLYKWDEEQGKAVALTKEERAQLREEAQERALEKGAAGTRRASKMEEHGNAESLETYCKGKPATDINQLMQRENISWQDLHSTLTKHGLELHKGQKGGYTVSAKSDSGEQVFVKASDVFRKHFSGKAARQATEEKLGPWEAPKEFLQHVVKKEKEYNPHREPKRDRQQSEEKIAERAKLRADLKARYQEYRTGHIQRQRIGARPQQEADRERFKELNRIAKERRDELRALKAAPEVRKALLSVAAAEAVQAREQLRAELAERRLQSRPQDYRAWVTERAKEGRAESQGEGRSREEGQR